MSKRDCVSRAIDAGELDKQRGDEWLEEYDRIYDENSGNMAARDADQIAADRATKQKAAENKNKKRVKLLSIENWRQVETDMADYLGDVTSPKDAGEAALALLAPGNRSPYFNASTRRDTIRNTALAPMVPILQKFNRNILQISRNKPLQRQVAVAAHGDMKGVAPEVKEMAEAWHKAAEYLRLAFNQAGGNIPKLDGWGMKHNWDRLKMIDAKDPGIEQRWKDDVLARVDREKMINYDTGVPLSDKELIKAVDSAYNTIRKKGTDDASEGNLGEKATSNTRNDHRFLVFKSGEDWMQLHEMYGQGSIFDGMMNHIDGMAKDIALMQRLGPNPNATLKKLQARVINVGAESSGPKALAQAEKKSSFLETTFNHYRGIEAGDGVNAARMASAQSYLTSSFLGGATITALPSDFKYTVRAAREINGAILPMIGRYVKLWKPGSDLQGAAIRMGLGAEQFSTVASAQIRYAGEMTGGRIATGLADTVLRASGLSWHTQAARWNAGLEFGSTIARHAKYKLDDLPRELKIMFEREGITANQWDHIRNTATRKDPGFDIISPLDVGDEFSKQRYHDMVMRQTDFFVPQGGLRAKASFLGDTKPGTAAGIVMSSGFMFKNFGLSLMFNQWSRELNLHRLDNSYKGQGMINLAAFLTLSTLAGGVAIQMKDVIKGKDARNILDPKFAAEAALKGGGFTLLGDLLHGSTNRYGGGLSETIGGPVIGTLGSAGRAVKGVGTDIAEGEFGKAGGKALDFAWRHTAGQSLWYTNMVMDRMVVSNLRQLSDPKSRQKYNRMIKKSQREKRQGYWWRPGQTLPDRAPDLGAILGGSQ